jgi:crotonobetainyl-CoA:carnitine CoA-transferase CaiB-like acyl-CoA transferase
MVPVQTFPTADGWVFIMCMTEKFWRILCEAIGRPDLPHDDRFATSERRWQNRETLVPLLDMELRKGTTEHWLARLTGKIPIAPVYDLAQALDAPFTRRTGMVNKVGHPARGDMRVLANPLKFDGLRPQQRACAPLGADNAVLLRREPA